MGKNFCLFLFITFILISLLNCTAYNEAELKSDLDQAIGEKYDIILDEDVLSESYGNQLLDILKDINDKNGHDIFLVIVAEFTGNLDSSAQSYAKSYCSSIEKCVFIIYDNSKKKIGSYFGKKTELNSLEMNSNLIIIIPQIKIFIYL